MPERVTGFAIIKDMQIKDFHIVRNGGEVKTLLLFHEGEKPYTYKTKSELIADLVLILKGRGFYVTHTLSVSGSYYYYDIYIKDLDYPEDAFKKYPCGIAVRGAMHRKVK